MFNKFVDPKKTDEYKELEDKYNKLTKDFIQLKKESKQEKDTIEKLKEDNLSLKQTIKNKEIEDPKQDENIKDTIEKIKENELEKYINIFLGIIDYLIKNKKIINTSQTKYIFSSSEDFRDAVYKVTNKSEAADQNIYLRVFRELDFIDTEENRFNKRKRIKGSIKRVFAVDRKKLNLIIDLLGDG